MSMVFSPGVSRLPNSMQCREDPGNSRAGKKVANMGSKSSKTKENIHKTHTHPPPLANLSSVRIGSNSELDTADGLKAT